MATGESKTKWDGKLVNKIAQSNNAMILTYEGKLRRQEVLSTQPSEYTCVYQGEESLNHLYFDDNLAVLASLLQDKSILNKVKLIYIDPPYATGGIFKSRSQQDAYTDLLSGAEYIEFLRHRLILLHEILAEDGSIYVHLDANMAFHVKIIMDELFGEKNFRSWITRKKCNPKNYTRKTYGNIADFILFYSKSDNYIWHRPYDQWVPENAKREYPYVEKETGRRYKKVPIHAPGTRNGATGKSWRGMLPPPGKHWQYTPAKLDEMDAKGEIYWSPTGNPRRKIYLDQSLGKPAQDIWLDFRDAHNQNIEITGYPTEKNPDLLRRIIQASSNPGDLILDCFAGSGTTLEIASQLDRRWIGIDNSHQAINTILKRFTIGKSVMGDFANSRQETADLKPLSLFDFAAQQSEGMTFCIDQEDFGVTKNSPPPFSIYTTSKSILLVKTILEKHLG